MLTGEQLAWVATFTGVDLGDGSGPSSANASVAAPSGPATNDEPPIVGEIRTLIATFKDAIQRIETDGVPASKLEPDLKSFQSRFDTAAKPVTDPKQQKAHDAVLQKLKGAITSKLAEVKPDADRQTTALTGGADSAINDMIAGAADMIAKAAPDKKQDLEKRLTQLKADVTTIASLRDSAKQAEARSKADAAAKKLIKDASTAVGDADKAEAKTALDKAYKSALADKYGITINKHGDMTPSNLHLDDLYDTLESVPMAHVAQGKMLDLSYKNKWMVGRKENRHGIGFSSGVGIELGSFGDETWPYNDPETKKPFVDPTTREPERPNGFRITVLHELGHSVDKRYNVMKTGDEAYGGWVARDGSALVADLAAPFIARYRGVLDEAIVTSAAHGAVFSGVVGNPPDGANPQAWADLANSLRPWAEMRASGAPWTQPRLALGNLNYVWSGNYATWYSYSKAARDKLETTDYQWSAPAEWFAELYAIYWYKQKPPPASVPPAVAAFMPGGSGGGDPAAQSH